MFVNNNIYNFEGRLRTNINIAFFSMRIGSSSNILIATIILAGPLRQNWIRSVGPI